MRRICANCKHYGKDKDGGYCGAVFQALVEGRRYGVRVDGRRSARACVKFEPLVEEKIEA